MAQNLKCKTFAIAWVDTVKLNWCSYYVYEGGVN